MPPDKRARTGDTSGSQLVAMFLPEASAVAMIITDARVMCMPVIAMSVPYLAAVSGRGGHRPHRHTANRISMESIFLISCFRRRVASGEMVRWDGP
jgi:hypothetical protein